jgi:hypothetical protein
VRHEKKHWLKPEVGTIELKQARELITSAMRMIEDEPELAQEQRDLRAIVDAIDSELHRADH